ncbi:MAG: HAMP domain-containing sensor histidine kinase [Pseudomonadota bacterium]
MPTSILQLTLIGFLVVSLPLIVALVFAVLQVDGLAGKGRRVVLDTAQAVGAGRIIVEQVSAMERSAHQFRILGDQSFYLHYVNRRAEFKSAIAILDALDLDDPQRQRLDRLIGLERDLYATLEEITLSDAVEVSGLAEFPPVVELARSLSFEISQSIAQDADEMRRQAKQAKQVLAFIAIALIPATVVLALTFTVLITRPLRRIDQEIRRLGSGEFSKPISIVRGPQDLRELSIRLDWLRTRLNELEEQKKSFLRDISHELKTPLSAIREGAELLNDGVVGPLSSEQLEVAAILRDNSLQLQKRIEDLLAFNVALSQSSQLRLERFWLDEIVSAVIFDHRLTIRSKNLHIDEKLAKVEVVADREKVKIIVDNLFSNAVKFSPASARIRIAVAAAGEVAQLDIEDQGPGIDVAERDRVFEAFYRGRVLQKGHVKGTGLGLAIVRQYVKAHHGDIKILDQAKGTHMRVYLPLGAEQEIKT